MNINFCFSFDIIWQSLTIFLVRCEDLATSLEESIFKEFKQTNPKYKNQVHGILEHWVTMDVRG